MNKSKHILCVCTGNVCRSPMAEYLLRERLGGDAGWEISSAGVFAGDGGSASHEAVLAMQEIGIDLRPHRSRSLTAAMVETTDLIVVMTRQHAEEVAHWFPEAAGRIHLITAWSQGAPDEDIPDPIGQSLDVYRRTRDRLDSSTADVILYIKDRWGLPDPPQPQGTTRMKVAIGSDHAGFSLKETLKQLLADHGLEVNDVGAPGTESCDYPDFAAKVAQQVSDGTADEGILICSTGIGMSITANKFPRVRAALCTTPRMAKLARQHNNANVLALGQMQTPPAEAGPILDAWLQHKFEGGRHQRRVAKIEAYTADAAGIEQVYRTDPEIHTVLTRELRRQAENLELIASENIASRAVREAQSSVLTNKYAEGYPGKRWYHGCEFVDEAERLAIERARELFGAEHANVQPHSGSGANMGVYFGMLEPGDTILAMSLDHGGHLTHGHAVNFSGRFFHVVHYGVHPHTELIDYDQIEALAAEHKPRLVVAGASAYSRIIDFERLRRIADAAGAWLMVDMAHIAGLVAAGCHPNPVPYCEFVTTTTHKTLRGPRGGMILCREKFAKDIDRQIFPGTQGGPFMHTIAAKAVCFHEALQPAFKTYQEQVVKNAKALAAAMEEAGFRIVSGGTDNHLMLVDLSPVDVTGKDAAHVLDQARITVNKNAIPFDTRSPFVTSGIRLGTPSVTTRGMKEPEMARIAGFIRAVLHDPKNPDVLRTVREEVLALTAAHPLQ